MKIKYPHIKVELIGEQNAFHILARVKLALHRAGVAPEEVHAFIDEAMSGDYSHLLNTIFKTVATDIEG